MSIITSSLFRKEQSSFYIEIYSVNEGTVPQSMSKRSADSMTLGLLLFTRSNRWTFTLSHSLITSYNVRHSSLYVPSHEPLCQSDVSSIQQFIDSVNNFVILTGAGISTESGLPDYRSKSVGLLNRPDYKPIVLKEFVESEDRRKSYWARNFFAWNRFKNFKPNVSHLVIADWQKEKPEKIELIVTQNVDRLHQKAGATNVVELHGHGYTVGCLKCPYTIDRETFQRHLEELNLSLKGEYEDSGSIRPDGDVDIDKKLISRFEIPSCPNCKGLLKPTIIFFGDNVPKVTVDKVYSSVSSSEGLLVIGSSLHVYSGYRFVLKAYELAKKIAIINIGPTRADHLYDITFVRKKAGDLLPLLRI